MMLEGLEAILDKQPVLSTVNADDLLQNPSKVEGDYQRHVATFVPMGDVSGFAQRLVQRVIKAKTPKGMIVAPYGYGKTSTLAFLWHACEEQGLVAVPPFYCATWLDVLNATYGWVKYRLEHSQPELLADLDDVYQKYTASTVDEMAERYAEEHGLARITAKGMLQDMLEEGSLVLSLTPSNLLFFLDAAAAIVGRANFGGLVILPDEFQQYISKGANLRRTIQEFREFVWGLDTRANTVGVIFSVPSYAEGGVIQERGKDILHRLKKDGLYYRLQDIYTQEFPARLWDRYCDVFQLGSVAEQVIDRHTLRAIGQIAEREDLGEGPRTVVDSFKRAILCYQDHGRPYTPVDLIDDFLESNIQFQAQANKIKRVTRQVLDSAAVDTPDKVRAVKLMAAFPRGCPIQVQKDYGVYDAINALSKQMHGELMTHLVEGYTLLGLRPSEGPTQTVDIIITRFWRGYEEDEIHLERAIRAFTNRLLPRFFQRRRGTTLTGWGDLDFTPSVRGSLVALVEGSFNSRFPHRYLGLQVAYKAEQIQPLMPNADLQFDFLFHLDEHDARGSLNLISERVVRFDLNLRQRVQGALPGDIQKLQDFVNPQFVTPLLMLSLVDYFDRWEEAEEVTIAEGDRSEIEFLIIRLLNHTAQMIFNRGVAESLSPPLRNVGGRMLEELFNRRCAALFPHYHTLYVQAHYEKIIDAYINAMRDMTLKERRGRSSLSGTKESLARRFGLGSVATFENRARNEYQHLMRIEQWTGRGDEGRAEIFLTLHPLEKDILKRLRASPTQREFEGQRVPVLDSNGAAELARRQGYRDEETLLTLQLLAARGYVRFDTQNKLIYLVQIGPDPAELEARVKKLQTEIERIPSELLPAKQVKAFRAMLTEAQNRLDEFADNEEELDEVQTLLSDLDQQLSDALSRQRDSLRQDLNALVLQVERAVIGLRQSNTLDRNIAGQVAFVMHLNELRHRLLKQQRKLAAQYQDLKEALTRAIARPSGGPISETLALYQALHEGTGRQKSLERERQSLSEQTHHLEQWIKLLHDTDRLFNALERLPDLQRDLTREVIPEIQAHLTKHGLNGLTDWETYRVKVKAVEDELEKRRRHGNERFGQVKGQYEAFLRAMDVRDYRPTTRYTYGEDEGSYQDLYREVQTKISERLDEINADLEQNQVDLLKAEYIQEVTPKDRPIVKQVKKEIAEAQKQIQSLRRALTISLIERAGEELDAYGERVQRVAQSVMDSRNKLGPILYAPHDLSEAEQDVLSAIGRRQAVDLTDLFVSLRQGGRKLEWPDLIELVDHLYRKNRILIRMSRRG